MESIDEIDKLTIPNGKTFDDKFYVELSGIFNKNDQWKSIVNMLGYQNYMENFKMSRNPTKTVLMFAQVGKSQIDCPSYKEFISIALYNICIYVLFILQSLEVSKDKLAEIFEELGEKRAMQCLHEWEHRY